MFSEQLMRDFSAKTFTGTVSGGVLTEGREGGGERKGQREVSQDSRE